MPDDGSVWLKHIVSLYESMDLVVSRPIICEVSLKTVLHMCVYVCVKSV
jgi:hypothetical protein